MRAFFANGADKMHIPWAVEGLPTLLHLSLFLFFGGLAIFLFNVDQEVFTGVVWWIGLFSVVYVSITLLPLIRQDSPYNAPVSTPAWFLYASIQYLTFKVLAFIADGCGFWSYWARCIALRNSYRGWMLGGVEKKAEDMTSEQSSKIDGRILGWTISALGDDDSLERFFEAIPGFFNSKLVKHLERDFPETHLRTFWSALDEFMGHTLSSNFVTESVKSRRDIICRDIMSMIPCPYYYMHDNLRSHFDQAPVLIDRLQAMARWCTHKNAYVADFARARVASNLASMQGRDDDWIRLASDVCGLAADDLRDDIAHARENLLLATLINVSRRTNRRTNDWKIGHVSALTEFDIRKTLPGLQHDFCTLWNEIVLEARKQGPFPVPVLILFEIRHLYNSLHQEFPTPFLLGSWNLPSSHPLCDIAGHRPDPTSPNSRIVSILERPGDSPDSLPHHTTSGSSTVSRSHHCRTPFVN
jgi:hypothetical protein